MFVKIFVILCLASIAYQDFKERAVYWFLFFVLGIMLGVLHYHNTVAPVFMLSVLLNFLLVSLIVLVLFCYSKMVLKIGFLNHSIGLGDLLFFYAIAVGFSTVSFVILFSFSILFSVTTFFFFKKHMSNKTVPLAGIMSVFFLVVFCSATVVNYNILNLY